ncbi:MAG: VOC family protein [Betaproteobacteria bacterium]
MSNRPEPAAPPDVGAPRCALDHIVVVAPALETGGAFVREMLGIAPQAGGKHARLGTHNLLLRLGDALYLEVIAIDPSAPPPSRPRWFGLDGLRPDAAPALAAWVARSPHVHASAAACPEPLGDIEPMSRGALEWLITIPADGFVPLDGIGPALIQWQTETHPASRLPDHGLSLTRLELGHPDPERVGRMLASLGLDHGELLVVAAATPRLTARIDTPQGPRVLSAG